MELYQAQYINIYIWPTFVFDWRRGTFAIIYFSPESVDSNSTKRKKNIHIYIHT